MHRSSELFVAFSEISMCGIFGFVAQRERPATDVLAGLKHLEYRGYDSWGVAVARNGTAVLEKAVGSISDAITDLSDARASLGHTRWATHGGVTQANAHPHLDCGSRFALIHNGIVENYRELGSRLSREHRFLSQTDTEVLVHLLEEELEREGDLLPALLRVFREVQGLSAVAVLDALTEQIAVAKNGSPLALGWDRDAFYVASDPIAIFDHTREIAFLEDGQAACISSAGIDVFEVADGRSIEPEMRALSWDGRSSGLNGYTHYMEKEIEEQPRVLEQIAGRRQDAKGLARAIAASRDIYLVGCGTAFHAALAARYMLSEIGHRSATAVIGSEIELVLPSMGPGSLVIAFSQSGETIDVLEAVRAARTSGATVAALVNAEGSALHRFADLSVLLGCGPERCVLSTKSYTAKLAVMQMTAYTVAGDPERGQAEVLAAACRLKELLRAEANDGAVLDVARRVVDHQHMFILGRHRNHPQALEAALKIKEVSYMHAEGFASGELKHGVIALITHGTPVLILAPDDDFRAEVLAAAAEVKARGAFTVGLSPEPEPEFDMTLEVSGAGSGQYEVAVLAQLLAYRLALLRGCDPDKPRNLAKSVTVK
jgi:glutamine---fructose-6-phosphate transaminase (isomerizing)